MSQNNYVPRDGLVWNPIFKYPRNQKCFCGTQKKFKKCCLLKMPDTVTPKEAQELNESLKTAGIK